MYGAYKKLIVSQDERKKGSHGVALLLSPSLPAATFLCALAAALLLFSTAVLSASERSHLSSDPEVNSARSLIEGGRFDEALAILRRLPTDRPDRTDILFLKGLAALKASQRPGAEEDGAGTRLDEAIAAFRAILIDSPGLMRVRLELARAFFLKRDDDLARRHFELALAGKPRPVVVANIQRFLHTMRARRRWQGRFGLAIASDSNLNTASGARTIGLDTPFGRLSFERSGDIEPKSGLGLSLWGGGEYQYPLSARLRLRAGADAALREYRGGDFDRNSASAHLGPRWLADPKTEASLLITVQRQWAAGQPKTDRLGLRMEVEHRPAPRLAMYGRANLGRRNCRDCDRLDGPVGDVALGANWVALPVLRFGVNAGWHWSRARDEASRNAGPEAGLAATLVLPAGFTVGARGAMHWTDYEGSGARHYTRNRKPREDRTRILSASVHNRALTVYGFSPRLSVINERHETNAQALDYQRNRADLSFVRLF